MAAIGIGVSEDMTISRPSPLNDDQSCNPVINRTNRATSPPQRQPYRPISMVETFAKAASPHASSQARQNLKTLSYDGLFAALRAPPATPLPAAPPAPISPSTSSSPAPVTPGPDLEQYRPERRCSPASSIGSHVSGISHPPGTRKRPRNVLPGVSGDALLNSIHDWDDGQKSWQSCMAFPFASFSPKLEPQHPPATPTMMDRRSSASPPLTGPQPPLCMDLKSVTRSPAEKRKANSDAFQKFRKRMRRHEAALERRIASLMEQLQSVTKERDDLMAELIRSERDLYRSEM